MRKILLDEMFPESLAHALADDGHDVVAVVANPNLRSKLDEVIFEYAAAEDRVLVTMNIRDFAVIHQERIRARLPAPGLWLVPSRAFGSGRVGMDRALRALLLASRSGIWPQGGTAMFLPRAEDR